MSEEAAVRGAWLVLGTVLVAGCQSPVPAPTASPTASPAATCSASPGPLPEQPGLPAPVAATRAALHAAATSCDWERLRALLPEQGFTHSFGGGQDPVADWRRAEREGGQPLRLLAAVLASPWALLEDGRHHAWPSAFARDDWSGVTAAEREDLRRFADERDLRAWEAFGAYAGHRVLIDADGTWRAFVAGD